MTDKTLPVTGGCLCGAIRFQSTNAPYAVSYCHCRICQKSCGNPYFLGAFFSVDGFRFTKGEPKYFRSSDWAERGFCADCGTPIIFRDGTDAYAIYIRDFAEQLESGDGTAFDPGIVLKPGAKLLREWGGDSYVVIALEDGFEFEGRRYRSLTKIAREITGAHWSGPRFFGLKRAPKPFAGQAVETGHE